MSLTKLGAALTVIFAVCIVALAVELYYVFRHRRAVSAAFPTDVDEVSLSSSKELLYFFCVNKSSPPPPPPPSSSPHHSGDSAVGDATKEEESTSEAIDVDLYTIGGAFGPTPRFLFTIKEEEREGSDSPKVVISAAAEVPAEQQKSRMSLGECVTAVEVEVDDVDEGDADMESSATPFSTPLASSPEFLTPSGSPAHEDV